MIPQDVQIEALRTAAAMAVAHRKRDGLALMELWAGADDQWTLVAALAAFPTVLLEAFEAGSVGFDAEVFMESVITAMAGEL